MIFWELFITFFKIGAFTFGGGYAMLPLIQKEVLAHKWMELESLVNFVAVSESTPGPFAVNMATYVGSEMGGQSTVMLHCVQKQPRCKRVYDRTSSRSGRTHWCGGIVDWPIGVFRRRFIFRALYYRCVLGFCRVVQRVCRNGL